MRLPAPQLAVWADHWKRWPPAGRGAERLLAAIYEAVLAFAGARPREIDRALRAAAPHLFGAVDVEADKVAAHDAMLAALAARKGA